MGPIGMPEMLVILVIALVVFGPRKLPELGRSLGKGLNEFKKAQNQLRSTLEDEIRIEELREEKAKVTAEQASAVAAAQVPTPGTPAEPGPPTASVETPAASDDAPVARPITPA